MCPQSTADYLECSISEAVVARPANLRPGESEKFGLSWTIFCIYSLFEGVSTRAWGGAVLQISTFLSETNLVRGFSYVSGVTELGFAYVVLSKRAYTCIRG